MVSLFFSLGFIPLLGPRVRGLIPPPIGDGIKSMTLRCYTSPSGFGYVVRYVFISGFSYLCLSSLPLPAFPPSLPSLPFPGVIRRIDFRTKHTAYQTGTSILRPTYGYSTGKLI